MKTKPKFLEFAKLFKSSPDIRVTEAIINLLDSPLILAEAVSGKIAAANHRVMTLTGFSSSEIQSLNIEGLLPEIQPILDLYQSNSSSDTTFKTSIAKRNQAFEKVQVQIIQPAKQSAWLIFLLEPEDSRVQREVEQALTNQRLEALQILLNSPPLESGKPNYQQMLQGGQLLTGASFLALYTLNQGTQKLEIRQQWGKSNFFPETISFSEVNHLRVPLIWTPGSQTTSELHRKAVSERLTYLATISIESAGLPHGLLVIGDQISKPPQDLIQFLQILAAIIIANLFQESSRGKTQSAVSGLHAQLNLQHTLLDAVTDGIVITDAQYTILQINQPAALRLGYQTGEVIGKTLGEILIADPPIEQLLSSVALNSGGLHNLGEARFYRRDGQPVLNNIRVVKIERSDHPYQFALILSDLSQHEEFRTRTKQLEQQALLGEVMAVFAHEVRNPINNISTALQLMASNFDKDSPLQEDIGRIKQDIHRLADLMKSVLSFSKTKEYQIESLDLNPLIANLIGRWAPRMERFHITHRIQMDPAALPVKGDRRALEQVFTNIIQNAINAMKASGGILGIKLEPSLTTDALPMIVVSISDTGPGIPDDIIPRIFEPFFTTSQEGTGLGLAITKHIIAAHNGGIQVSSFEGGTVFRIKLPADISNN